MGLVERLRQDVLAGRLPSGERLPAAEVARRHGVSLTVVREALVALVGQGLVVNEPQAGFAVTSLSVEDLLDLTAVRVEIEALALRGAVRSGDLAWEAAAVAAHHVLVSLPMTTADGVMSEVWTRAHAGFHEALAAGCCSPTLLGVRRRLYDRAELYRWWSIEPGRAQGRDVACEHRELLEAMLSRDADLAVDRITRHIETTTMLLLTSRPGADRKTEPDLADTGRPPADARADRGVRQ